MLLQVLTKIEGCVCVCVWGHLNKSTSPCLWSRVVTAGILSRPLLATFPTHTHYLMSPTSYQPQLRHHWGLPGNAAKEPIHIPLPTGPVSFVTVSTFLWLPLHTLVHACLRPIRVARTRMTRPLLLPFLIVSAWVAVQTQTFTDLRLRKQEHPCTPMPTGIPHCLRRASPPL